jgi:hypothetical protein
MHCWLFWITVAKQVVDEVVVGELRTRISYQKYERGERKILRRIASANLPSFHVVANSGGTTA